MYSEDENLSSIEKLRMNFFVWVALFLSLLFSCVVVHYVASPAHRETKIIKGGNEIKEEQIRNNNMMLARIIKTNDENRKLDDESIEKIKSFISNRNNYEDYLAHIVKLANSKNIKISDFSINESENQSKIKNKNVLKEMEINFAASSGFLNFISFLKSLEKSVPLVHEELIVISIGDESKETNESEYSDIKTDAESILDYEMKLKFYYY